MGNSDIGSTVISPFSGPGIRGSQSGKPLHPVSPPCAPGANDGQGGGWAPGLPTSPWGTMRGRRAEGGRGFLRPASGRTRSTDLLAQSAVDVRGHAPIPPRLIHRRVHSAAIRGYRAPSAHPAWTRAASAPAARPGPHPALFRLAPELAPARLSVASGRLPSWPGCAASSPLLSGLRGAPELCRHLRGCWLPFCKKLQRKLPAPLVAFARSWHSGAGHRLAAPTPPRPAFVLLPHPALEPGRDSRIPLWGCGRPALPWVPAECRARAGRPTFRTAAPRSRAAPRNRRASVCDRVPPQLAASWPPGASFARWGNWGPGFAHASPAPAPRGAGGWELESFFRWRWLGFLPALLPRCGGELSHLGGGSGWPPGFPGSSSSR